MKETLFHFKDNPDSPLLATAIHAGHEVRNELKELLGISDEIRLREEDPFTDELARLFPSYVIARRSRFEVDLNRPREEAVYTTPEDAWGLKVWKQGISDETVQKSLEEHDLFYRLMNEMIEKRIRKHGGFLLLDLHSYNHRRKGQEGPAGALEENPAVNLGTKSVLREWKKTADLFSRTLLAADPGEKFRDIRENVKFKGANLVRWANSRFGEKGAAIAVEFKKEFMDEWTGRKNPEVFAELKTALEKAVPKISGDFCRMIGQDC